VLSSPESARLDAALAGLDCMIAVDNWLNETTRHAHVILPGLSPLEQPHCDDLIWAWAVRNAIKYSEPIFAPEPDAAGKRPAEWELLLAIAGILQGARPADTDPRALDALFFGGLVAALANAPGTPIAGRDPAEIVAATAGVGPERLLDFSLRIGPWGDRYGANPNGLTLAAVAREPNGIDRGPLEPRLDEMLRTPSGKLELAPAPITADLARLRERLARGSDGLVLVSRRHLRSNNSWMHNAPSLMTGKDRCTLLVHPDDARRLGLEHGKSARIESRAGSLVAPIEVSDEMLPGVVSLPHGWGHDKPGVGLSVATRRAGVCNNVLAPGDLVDVPSGNAVVNGVPVEVSPA
jgi:anaerobic selenocysteine-containing dehydrogenase